MHVDAVLDDVVTKIIGLAKRGAFIDARASHQDREAAWVVIAAVVRLSQGALGVNCAPEFAAPDNQGVIE